VATYQHPGIYIQEIPSARSIQGASTSVAAFVGVTDMGPINTPTLVTSWSAYARQFGGLVWMGFNSWAVYEFFQEGGAACYVVRLDDSKSSAATASIDTVKLAAASKGSWGASLMYYICNSVVQKPKDNTPPPQTPVFNFQVVVLASLIDNAIKSKTENFTLQLLANYVSQNGLAPTVLGTGTTTYYVLETFSGFTNAGPDFAARINAQSMFVRVTQPGSATARPGNTASPTAFSGGTNGDPDFTNALNSLKTIQGLSLLAQPDTVALTDTNGKADLTKQATMINQGLAVCQDLTSLFYAADPPFGQDPQQIVAFKSGTGTSSGQLAPPAINSSYGSLYYPWTWVFNPLSNSSVPIPPSGPVLGRYAFTDSSIGVWKSPAGVNDGAMRSVVAVERQLTEADQNDLNPNGINALRNLINYGNVIYGARTVSQDTQWTYLSVRRLFIYVEQSLKNSLQWVVFEPNGQTLWAAVTRDIDAFLTTLWQQGGLFGATPQEAFFVTCDASNNPPETRMLGQLFIDIGLAPVYPAEFVVIRITQKTAGPDSGS
jgi:phage tail sheath protein FI